MILAQRIAATTRGRIVKRLAEIVAPEKPFEAKLSSALPIFVTSDSVRLETGREHRVRFQRLLIEPRSFTTLRPEAVASDRRKVSAVRDLRLQQPAQRGETDFEHLALRSPMA